MATELFKLMGRITIEMDDAEADLKRFEGLLIQAVDALQSIDTHLTTVNTTLSTMDTKLSDANAELKDLDSKATSAKTAVNTLDGEVTTLNDSMNTADSRVNAVVNELKELDSKAKTAGDQLVAMDGKLNKLHNPFSSDGAIGAGAVWLGNILEDLTYKALDLSWEFMKIGINFNASAESYQASFKTMLGVTEQEAEAIYERLRRFAVDTPYSMEGVADSAVRLFNAGYDVDSTLEMLEVFGNIANGDSAKMQRLVKAWTDTKGYGRLRAQERNQFVENGVMIDQLLADYYQSQGMEITADQIMKKLEAKEVAAVDVMNALVMSQLEGGNFYRAMANIMDTYRGQMEKTGDQLDETAGAFTLPIFETLKNDTLPEITSLLTEFKTWAEQNEADIQQIAATLSDMAIVSLDGLLSVFKFCVENKDILVPVLGAIAAEMAAMAAAAHPFAAVAVLLGALIAFMDTDWQNFESNYPQLVDMFEKLTGLDFTNVADSLTKLQDGFKGIITWFEQNEDVVNMMITALGALAFVSGHPVVGTAMVAYGVGELWNSDQVQQYNKDLGETGVPAVVQTPFVTNPDNNYDVNGLKWVMDWIFKKKDTQDEADEEETGKGGTSGSLSRLRENMYNQGMLFASANGMPERGGDYGFSTFDGRGGVLASVSGAMASGGIVGLIASVQGLTAAVQSMTGEIPSAISAGVGNISVTGTVTTGNVVLDTGAIVGQLAPRMNLVLGGLNMISGRG